MWPNQLTYHMSSHSASELIIVPQVGKTRHQTQVLLLSQTTVCDKNLLSSCLDAHAPLVAKEIYHTLNGTPASCTLLSGMFVNLKGDIRNPVPTKLKPLSNKPASLMTAKVKKLN